MRQVIALIVVVVILLIGTSSKAHIPKSIILSEPTPVEQFMDKIAAIETPGGGYQTVNKYGMMGRYQFSPQAVKAVGLRVSKAQFLQNKELQDTAMVRLMTLHEEILSTYIEKYDGRIIKGVRINRATIIAGAHFAGAGGIKSFLTNNSHSGTVDGFGTSLRTYMSRFSNFHLPPLRG